MRVGLLEVGAVTRKQAVLDFEEYGPSEQHESHTFTAEGFKVRVRATSIVVVEQTRPITSGFHPEYGGLMMTKGLLPAREKTADESAEILEAQVVKPLREAGFV